MEQGRQKQKKTRIILASVILHCLLLLLAFLDFQFPLKRLFVSEPAIQKKDWATRNPGSSRFGAPVVFQNQPSPQTNQKKESKEKTRRTKKKHQKLIERKHAPVKKILKQEITKPNTERLTPTPTTMTMAHLLQGYLEQTGSGSDAGLRHDGTKKQPPDEQIKYERYAQKIHWCIQNAFNISKRTLSLAHAVRSMMRLHIEFKDNGTVQSVKLLQSSGSAALDQFMLQVVAYAGSSFPPIPDSLDKSLLPHTYTIAVDVPATTGSNMRMSL